jgi:hypothetical protein
MWGRVYADFRHDRAYFATVFDLILSLYQIPPNTLAVADLRESLYEFLDFIPEELDTLPQSLGVIALCATRSDSKFLHDIREALIERDIFCEIIGRQATPLPVSETSLVLACLTKGEPPVWEIPTLQSFLARAVIEDVPIAILLLPGNDQILNLPRFLGQAAVIDLSQDEKVDYDKLTAKIQPLMQASKE